MSSLVNRSRRCWLMAPMMLLSMSTGAAEDLLRFPKDNFTLETKTVRTTRGEKHVTYRAYRHLPYVAKPVDEDFQSLNVDVPIEVDGTAVDASKAPILLSIPVGGYMSARNAGHGADLDAEEFIAWVGKITGFAGRP